MSVEKYKQKGIVYLVYQALRNNNYIYNIIFLLDSLGPPGRWIRHKLLESILYGTPVLVAIQVLAAFS